MFLGEVDTYYSSDSAAIRINFYKPPHNIEKQNEIFKKQFIDRIGSPDQMHYVSIKI